MNLPFDNPSSLFVTLLAAISFYAPTTVRAEPTLDLMAAWQQAQSHDATFSAARAADMAAQEKRTQGDALIGPQVALSGGSAQSGTAFRSGDTQVKQSMDQSGQKYTAAVALTQPIYDAGAQVNRSQLRKQADQADLTLQQATQDLVLRTSRAYFDVLVSSDSLKLLQSQKLAISQQLDLAKQSFNLGLMTSSDVNDAQSKFDAIVASEIAGQVDLETKKLVFRQVTGVDAENLTPVTNVAEQFGPDAHDLSFWLERSGTESLTIRSQQLAVAIAADEIRRYTLRNSPVLSLTTSLGKNWDAGSISSSGGRDRTTNASIGLVLNIPLYDGGARQSKLRQAFSLDDQQKYSLEEVRRDADRLTRQYFTGVLTGAQRVQALIKSRDSAAAAVASTRLGQEVGVRNIIDVLTAQQSLFQASLALITARYDYLLNRLQLSATAGALDQQALLEVNAFLQKP